MKALIDTDGVVYRSGFSVEHMFYRIYLKGEEEFGFIESFDSKKKCDAHIKFHDIEDEVIIEPHLEVEPLENALANTKNTVESILGETGADKYVMYLGGEGNYREDLVDYYKANRRDARKPVYYSEIREYLINNWGAELVNGMEADDACGIAQWEDYTAANKANIQMKLEGSTIEPNYRTIICSNDKDLNMIPGWHYNWVKREKYWVTEDEATTFYYTQLLTGDSTDNIAGVPKCGPVTAGKILEGKDTESDMYTACLAEYERVYPNLGYIKLKENADLLWILREKDKLWTPPNS